LHATPSFSMATSKCLYWKPQQLDVRRSVHHIKFMKKNPTRFNNVSKFYYSIFIWSSTCFGRHTAHHREPKTALAASDFLYVEGCWTCRWWTLSGTLCLTTSVRTTTNTDWLYQTLYSYNCSSEDEHIVSQNM
jgi:hypothetical protein